MKIGTCVSFDALDGLEEKLAGLNANSFTSCQLTSWTPEVWTDENAQAVRALLQQYGITVSAFWCGWTGPAVWDFYDGPRTLGLVPPEYRRERVQQLCDGADFARKLGITDVITHMGFIPDDPNSPVFAELCAAVRTLAVHLKRNGQRLLFETGQETPVTMLRCFETVGTDNLGVNLDTANLILYGSANPVDALEVFGRYVFGIHAKDGCYPTNGHELGRETRLGEGRVDFPALFRALRALGYDGDVTIERELEEGCPEQVQDVLDGRAYLQAILDEIDGGSHDA